LTASLDPTRPDPTITHRVRAKSGHLSPATATSIWREEKTVDRLLLKPREAAVVLGISATKMYELIVRREIVSVKIGGCRRVPVEALTAYVAALVEDAA
jgi:excisionase family DNA binding protein